MSKILTSLLIAAILSSAVVLAEDTLRTTTTENGQRRVEFTLHGNTSCVLVDDKIFCAPGARRAPIKLASRASN